MGEKISSVLVDPSFSLSPPLVSCFTAQLNRAAHRVAVMLPLIPPVSQSQRKAPNLGLVSSRYLTPAQLRLTIELTAIRLTMAVPCPRQSFHCVNGRGHGRLRSIPIAGPDPARPITARQVGASRGCSGGLRRFTGGSRTSERRCGMEQLFLLSATRVINTSTWPRYL